MREGGREVLPLMPMHLLVFVCVYVCVCACACVEEEECKEEAGLLTCVSC